MDHPFASINDQNLSLFFKYIAERHSIYKKKASGMKKPWTDDNILQGYKFTNVFRDLDPGTSFVIDEIIPKCRSVDEVIFNIIIYRLFNKISTFKANGIQHAERFNKVAFESNIRKLKDSGIKVFTNAFIVSGYSWMNGKDKIENVCIVIDDISKRIPEIAKQIIINKDSEFAFQKIKSLKGIGDFLAYQICVDIGYYDKTLYDEDSHVVCGPGCKRGLERIFSGIKDYEACIKYLESIQQEQFAGLGINEKELFNGRHLNLMALENCLCEFSKYMKALKGEGRPRNKYSGL